MPTRMMLTPSDYVVVVGYFILVLGIGLWFRKRLTNVGEYFAGGKPDSLVDGRHLALHVQLQRLRFYCLCADRIHVRLGGCHSFLGQHSGLPGWRLVVCPSLAQGPRHPRPSSFSKSATTETIRQLFAWAGIPMKIFDDALKVFATGLFVSVACGVRLSWSIVICGVVMVAYTFFGGLWALVVTDYVSVPHEIAGHPVDGSFGLPCVRWINERPDGIAGRISFSGKWTV